jgi:5-methylcytosine-specific restriction endonuclease McrA
MRSEMVSKLMIRFRKHFPKTKWEEVDGHFHFMEKENLFCEYCGIKLLDEAPFPYKEIVSIDHKQPKNTGGVNSFDNVAICCTRCNIVKGTMTEKTFKDFHEILNTNPELKERIFEEMFWGWRANMLNRKNKKEKPVRYLHEFV